MVIDELVIRLVAEGIAKTKAELEQAIKAAQDAQKKLDSMTDRAEAKRERDAARALRQQEQAAARQRAAISKGHADFFNALGKIDGLFGKIAMTASLALTAGLGTAVAAVRSFVKEATQLESIAHFTSMTTQEFQALAYAGEQSGISAEKLADGFRQFNAGFRESVKAGGKGAVAEAIRDLGLNFNELKHQDPKAVFYEIMGAAERAGPSMHRAGAFAKAFGEIAGANLARGADLGVNRLKALEQEAHDLGLVMSDETVAAGIALDQSFRRVGATVEGLRNQLGTALAPIILEVSEQIKTWTINNRGLIASKFKEWLEGAVSVGRELVTVFREWWPTLESIVKLTVEWGPALVQTAIGLKGLLVAKEVVSVITGLGAAFSSAQVGAVGLAGVLGPGGAVFLALTALLPLALQVGDVLGDIGSMESKRRVTLAEELIGANRSKFGDIAGAGIYVDKIAALSEDDAMKLRKEVLAGVQSKSSGYGTLAYKELFNQADAKRQQDAENKAAREAIAAGIMSGVKRLSKKELASYVDQGYITQSQADLVEGQQKSRRFLNARQKDGKKEVTDAELAKLIASAAKSGATLDEVLKGRKIAGGVPPVITVRLMTVNIQAPITVTGKAGQSTGQLAQDVRIEFSTMLERELQKHSTTLMEAR